ncbi:MAG: SusD/RagB family nutrient-binding outer membrane lipoprotein [Bacteroidia bacterium]|nr:SusD/RagB family nutrient-binding outer membrane lipoprotein [Bacteroidia bacterium]
MKIILRFVSIILAAGALFNSCETTELDLRTSPNDLAPDQADPNLLLNFVQLQYAASMSALNNLSAALVRIDLLTCGSDYFNCLPGPTLNGTWTRTYVDILPNLQILESQDAGTGDLAFQIAVAKTLYAHSLILLVDFAAKANFSQAGNPKDFPAPLLDSGEEVYEGAMQLLDEAYSLFSADPITIGVVDLFYDADIGKWRKLINTIKLKVAYTTGNAAMFNSIITGGEFISSAEDDFFFQYGTRELVPDTRHPDYAVDYTPSGAGLYRSNWMMRLMLDANDPRLRYYFYRQVDATPGVDAPTDENVQGCGVAPNLPHYEDGGFTICPPPLGYWGRSHGSGGGRPPDNFLITAVGVYPAGGRFDDDSFGNVGIGLGGGGAGIEPIIMSSYVDFWRGYMATSDGERANFLRSGMTKSIATVQSYGALDSNADLANFEPQPNQVASYIDLVVSDFLTASGDDMENIYAEQYWTALYGGAAEAWTYYRLTGYPTTLQPMFEANPGPFPRSLLYAQNEVVNNANLRQKESLTEQVFWDTNPPSPTYPPAN